MFMSGLDNVSNSWLKKSEGFPDSLRLCFINRLGPLGTTASDSFNGVILKLPDVS